MAIKSESDRRQRLGLEGVDNKNNDGDILQQLAEGGNEEKIILDERKNGMLYYLGCLSLLPFLSSYLPEKPKIWILFYTFWAGDATNVNEKILKKADKNSSKYKFRPNRFVKFLCPKLLII